MEANIKSDEPCIGQVDIKEKYTDLLGMIMADGRPVGEWRGTDLQRLGEIMERQGAMFAFDPLGAVIKGYVKSEDLSFDEQLDQMVRTIFAQQGSFRLPDGHMSYPSIVHWIVWEVCRNQLVDIVLSEDRSAISGERSN